MSEGVKQSLVRSGLNMVMDREPTDKEVDTLNALISVVTVAAGVGTIVSWLTQNYDRRGNRKS